MQLLILIAVFFVTSIISVVTGSTSLIDYQLGVILGITMFIGAMVGARVVRHLSNLWLRHIFLATVIILAVKTLV